MEEEHTVARRQASEEQADTIRSDEIQVVELDERIEFGVGILSESDDDDEWNGFCPNKNTCNVSCC